MIPFKITRVINAPTPPDAGQNNFPTLSSRKPNTPTETAQSYGATIIRPQVYNICGGGNDSHTGTNGVKWGFSAMPKEGDKLNAATPLLLVEAIIRDIQNAAKWGEGDSIYRYDGGYWDGDFENQDCQPVSAVGKILVWGCYNFFADTYAYGKHLFFCRVYHPNDTLDLYIYVGDDIQYSVSGEPSPIPYATILGMSGATDSSKPIYHMSVAYSVGVCDISGLEIFPAAPQYGGNMPSPGYNASMNFGLQEESKQIYFQESGNTPTPSLNNVMGFIDPLEVNSVLPPWRNRIVGVNHTFPINLKKG